MFAIFRAKDDKEKETTSKEWVAAVKKDIEPLLEDAGPFFGGSSELTLAEVCSYELASCSRVLMIQTG